jgi:hypothetical protein
MADSEGPAICVVVMRRRSRFPAGMTNKGCGCLFGGHFFLFAFHAHEFEFALFGFDGGGYFLLDLGCHFLRLIFLVTSK